MPNEDVKFSELPVGTLASDSIFATSENDGNGGLISTGVSAADVGNFAIDNLQYPLKLNTENKKVAGAINELHAINGYSYDAYDDTSTYAAGDLCIYNNALYKCTTAITTAEAWNASHWTATSIADEISELNTDKQDKLSNSDIPITVLSQSVSDVTLKCTRYGNVACITGYFRTTASISANSSIFSGFPNPVVPSSDANLYFTFLNETDNNLMRFRINRNYCELKNPVILPSGKTFVGTVTYICD